MHTPTGRRAASLGQQAPLLRRHAAAPLLALALAVAACGQPVELAEQRGALTSPTISVSNVSVTPSTLDLSIGNLPVVSWTDTVVNGPATADWIDKIYVSSSATLDLSHTAVAAQVTRYKNNNGGPTSLAVPIAYDQTPGTYYVFVQTPDSLSSAVPLTVTRTRTTAPDLIVTTAAVPSVVYGDPRSGRAVVIGVTYSVANIGTLATASKWADALYLSADAIWDPSDVMIGSAASDPQALQPGQTWTGGTVFGAAAVPAGTYNVLVKVDTPLQFYELSSTNNAFVAGTVTVPATGVTTPADLEVVGVTAPSTLSVNAVDTPLPMTWSDQNIGNSDLTDSQYHYIPDGGSFDFLLWYDRVCLSVDAVLDASDTCVDVPITDGGCYLAFSYPPVPCKAADLPALRSNPSVLAGGTWRAVAAAPRVPKDIAAGTYHIIVITNAQATVTEDPGNDSTVVPQTITITSTAPDLIANNVTGPTTIDSNTSPVVTWTDMNVGTGPTNNGTSGASPWWPDSAYLSRSPTGATVDVPLGTYQNITVLAAGGSLAVGGFAFLPPASTVADGTYYLAVRVNDGIGYVTEDQRNNVAVAASPVTVVHSDLTVSALSGPASVNVPGAAAVPISASWTESNQGTGVAHPGQFGVTAWQDAAYLSKVPYWDASAIRLGASYSSPLAPGASSNVVNVALAVPGTIAPGSYYLLVRADDLGAVVESDETNNVFVSPTMVTVTRTIPLPDLQVTGMGVYDPASGQDLGNPFLEYWKPLSNVTIDNVATTIALMWSSDNRAAGPAYAPWTDAFYLSADATLDSGDLLLASVVRSDTCWNPSYGYVGCGGPNSTTLPLPAGLASGTYYLIAETDHGNSVGETDETNNWRASAALVVTHTAPDLAPAAVTAPATLVVNTAGTPLTATWTEQNLGSGAAQAPWVDVLYLSTDLALDPGDVVLGTFAAPTALGAGAAAPRQLTVTVPGVTKPNAYYLLVAEDSGSAVSESVETNNVAASAVVTVHTVAPDLTPTSLSSPGAVAINDVATTVTATWTDSNVGVGATQSSFTDIVYLSTDPTLDAADVAIGNTTSAGLAAAGFQAASATVTLPAGQAAGTYYLIVRTDANDQIVEDSETNNITVSGAFTVTRTAPDLAPTGLATVATVQVDNVATPIAVTWTQRNTGTGTTQAPWIDLVYLSNNLTLDSGDAAIGYAVAGNLAAGASVARQITAYVPGSTASGTYYLFLVSDASKKVTESSETNNVLAAGPLVVTHVAPDLAITAVTAPTAATVDNVATAITVQWTDRNAGSGATQAAWTDTVYLSANNVLDGGDLPIATLGGTSLAAGATLVRSVSAPLPATLPTASYYVMVQSDTGNTVTESAEDNNTRPSAAMAVTHVAPDVILTALTAPASVTINNTTAAPLGLGWTDKNAGTGVTQATWTDAAYLSTDGVLDAKDTPLGTSATAATLAAGAATARTATMSVPGWVPAGTYYVILVADSTGAVAESNESNNTRVSAAVTVARTGLNLLVVARTGTGAGTITSSPAGINCGGGGACYAGYGATASVTLTAQAAAGSSFAGWSGGGCSGTGTCVVSMATARLVTATFNLNSYAVTTTRAGVGSGTIVWSVGGTRCTSACTASLPYGSTLVLTAQPDPGSTFGGWSGGGCGAATSCTVTVTGAVSITGTFLGWPSPPVVVVPPLPPAPDRSALPLDPQGEPIIAHTELVDLVAQTQPDAISARGACGLVVTNCYDPATRSLDSCMMSAPRCQTTQPWTEAACCADACWTRYATERAAGTSDLRALRDVLFGDPSCMPGVTDGVTVGEPPALVGITAAHNAARAQVGAPPLSWDPNLAAIADAWARQCVDDGTGMEGHNPNRGANYHTTVGENIAASTDPLSGPGVVDMWTSERAWYDPVTNTCANGQVCGHYTQLIWGTTTAVGCATHTCPNLALPTNVVCDYGPAGNTAGQHP